MFPLPSFFFPRSTSHPLFGLLFMSMEFKFFFSYYCILGGDGSRRVGSAAHGKSLTTHSWITFIHTQEDGLFLFALLIKMSISPWKWPMVALCADPMPVQVDPALPIEAILVLDITAEVTENGRIAIRTQGSKRYKDLELHPFLCPVQGCGLRYRYKPPRFSLLPFSPFLRRKGDLKVHCKRKHDADEDALASIGPNQVTKKGKQWPCSFYDCPHGYELKRDLVRHMRMKHARLAEEAAKAEYYLRTLRLYRTTPPPLLAWIGIYC
jgi:hypothetical protein